MIAIKKPDGMIGLSVAAGKVSFGSESSVDSVRKGKAKLVIVATDASDRTKKLMYNKCGSYSVDIIEYATVLELGRITGKNQVSALAVCDKGLASEILKIYGGVLNG